MPKFILKIYPNLFTKSSNNSQCNRTNIRYFKYIVNKLHYKHSTASASYMYAICHIDNMIPLQVDLLFHVPWSEDLYI